MTPKSSVIQAQRRDKHNRNPTHSSKNYCVCRLGQPDNRGFTSEKPDQKNQLYLKQTNAVADNVEYSKRPASGMGCLIILLEYYMKVNGIQISNWMRFTINEIYITWDSHLVRLANQCECESYLIKFTPQDEYDSHVNVSEIHISWD